MKIETLSLIIIGTLGTVCGMFIGQAIIEHALLTEEMKKNGSCEYFKNDSINDLPARCFEYYQIKQTNENSGC